ncbi:MAG: TROVE domain-containing protein, partial [Gemmataceae bacterium]|nr:TROVE domain-containing protein [Gemmataceae bacterium]
MRYADHLDLMPDAGMAANSAGGWSFAVDDWTRLDRFLILGCEGGSYYASERKLSRENAQAVLRCVAADGPEAVRRIVAVSVAGRAPKNDPAVFALALACAHGDALTKKAAYAAVPQVCRTGTHLFQFASASDALRGWGRGLRQAVAGWYAGKDARTVAYQAAKYQQRDGWSHRDLLRLAHPKASGTLNDVFAWIVRKPDAETVWASAPSADDALAPLYALDAARRAKSADEVVRLVRDYRLVREGVPTEFLASAAVWEALLEEMPLAALVRNLATMTRVGLLSEGSAAAREVVARLDDVQRLRKARLHPLAVLVALKTYASGRGVRGKGTWTPAREIVEALDRAFYAAFAAVEPTGKRWLLALDVSGSMGCGTVAGAAGLTPRVAAAAMALVTAAEPSHALLGFSDKLVPVPIEAGMTLDQAAAAMDRI